MSNAQEIKNLPASEYHAMSKLSASIIRKLVEDCPAMAWSDSWLNPDREDESTPAMDLGTLSHSIILEGHADNFAVINPEHYPSTTGSIPKGWTNKAIKEARDLVESAGQIAVLPPVMKDAKAMAASVGRYLDRVRLTAPEIPAAFQPGGGDAEITITWTDAHDVPCRVRPDLLSTDRRLCIDLKTTGMSANPMVWSRQNMVNLSSYVSAALYKRGIKAMYGVECEYVFLVVNTSPPYLCSLVGCDPHALEIGLDKVSAGVALWAMCEKAGYWPAYPEQVSYPEIPVWVDRQWDEQQGMYEHHVDRVRSRAEVAKP